MVAGGGGARGRGVSGGREGAEEEAGRGGRTKAAFRPATD